eukprot:2556916-Pyramimonas_sp.AAC.1
MAWHPVDCRVWMLNILNCRPSRLRRESSRRGHLCWSNLVEAGWGQLRALPRTAVGVGRQP